MVNEFVIFLKYNFIPVPLSVPVDDGIVIGIGVLRAGAEYLVDEKYEYHSVLVIQRINVFAVVRRDCKIQGSQAVIGHIQKPAGKLPVLGVNRVVQIPFLTRQPVLPHGVKEALFKKRIAIHDSSSEDVGAAGSRINLRLSAVHITVIFAFSGFDIFLYFGNIIGYIFNRLFRDFFDSFIFGKNISAVFIQWLSLSFHKDSLAPGYCLPDMGFAVDMRAGEIMMILL